MVSLSDHKYSTEALFAQNLEPLVHDTSDLPISNIELYMPHSHGFHSSGNSAYPFGLADAQSDLALWSMAGGNLTGVANSMGSYVQQGQNHHRQPSTSSIGSPASMTGSPYQAQQSIRGAHGSSQPVGKTSNFARAVQRPQSSMNGTHLPTPSQTPTRNTFLSQQAGNFPHDINSAVAASMLMNQALLDQNTSTDDDVPHMTHSNRPSFSSVGQAPATPMTIAGDRHDDSQHAMHESMTGPIIPKFNRTVTDAYQDNLYFAQQQNLSHKSDPAFLMPTNSMVNDRLMEAQMARSQSSGSNQSASMSPFRSTYKLSESEQRASGYRMSPQTESEPKTISPKDAVLDYKAAATDYPLFPQSSADLSASYQAVSQPQSNMVFSTSSNWSNISAFANAPLQQYNNFATPALPSSMSNSYNGMTQTARSIGRQMESTPEFNPAQLTRMESSASDAPQSSAGSSAQILTSPKPESSAADSGTYSCTYHGCLQRFTTPQKLQKHKRDAHRNNPHITPGVGSGMTTAQLMERNSQTGPHICERVNPTTGKPCNAIFSRPYDLTRHEDTIHNGRKQKVRCAICIEDKTFSRSDALTRHMRVVHPEIDFPGKHRKRGARDD